MSSASSKLYRHGGKDDAADEEDDWETIMKPSSSSVFSSSSSSSSSLPTSTELTYVSIHPTPLSFMASSTSPSSPLKNQRQQKAVSIHMTPSLHHQQNPYRGHSAHHDCLQMATPTKSKRTRTIAIATKSPIVDSSLPPHMDEKKEVADVVVATKTTAAVAAAATTAVAAATTTTTTEAAATTTRRRTRDGQYELPQLSPPIWEANEDRKSGKKSWLEIEHRLHDDNDDRELPPRKPGVRNSHQVVATSSPGMFSSSTTSADSYNGSSTVQTIMVSAGNILVWYDFAIFGFFSDVLGKLFFPDHDDKTNFDGNNNNNTHSFSLMESFAVFGLAFLMRPIGGLMFGYIGDTRGRKCALQMSIFLMAIATFALGCLPTYSMVGQWAIPMLIAARMLQGLSVGGHLMSSLVYTLERCPQSQWGWYGSFVIAAANFGTLLAGLSAFAIHWFLPDEEILQWAWRIPFLFGVVVCLSGFYLCLLCDDDELSHHNAIHKQQHQQQHGKAVFVVEKKNPLREAFRRGNLRSLLAAAMVPMLWSAGFYLSFVWMATYMKDLVHPPVRGAFAVNSSSLFLSVCIGFPIAGRLSDTFGRKLVMTIGGACMGILGPILVMVIAQNSNPLLAFASQSMIGISLSCWGGPMCAWLVESFEPGARLTSVATGYNLAQAIVGGFTPLLATVMVRRLGVDSPGFILSALATISLMGLWIVSPQARLRGKPSSSFQNVPSDEPSIISSKGSSTVDTTSSFSDDLDDKYKDEDDEYLEGNEIT